jgi:hypothetical protein
MRHLGYLAVLVTIAFGGCGGGSPAAPSDPPTTTATLPFTEGSYALEFHGGTLECGDFKIPQAGTVVSFTVMLRRDVKAWNAVNGTNTLALRFESAAAPPGVPNPFALGIAASARGFAEDEGLLVAPGLAVPPNGTRMTFADNATLSGSMPSAQVNAFSLGTVNGTVIFSRNGVTSTCPPGIVTWTMNRVP